MNGIRKPVIVLSALLIIFLGLFVIFIPRELFAASAQDSVDVRIMVEGCNNNGICEPLLGEDILSCSLDCDSVTPTSTPTTTPTSTAPESDRDHRNGSRRDPDPRSIYDVTIIANQNSATITWKTHVPALSYFSWGRTEDYEIGTISEVSYTKDHSIKIFNLASDTTYYFLIQSKTVSKNPLFNYSSSFDTFSDALFNMLPNVESFSIQATDSGALWIRWINPTMNGFDGVRIVRSEFFFPKDPLNGEVVYEGKGEALFDAAVRPGVIYYYSIVVRDILGNYSSGRIGFGMISRTGYFEEEAPFIHIVTPLDSVFEETPSDSDWLKNLNGDSVEFFQNGKRLPNLDGIINGRADLPLAVRLKVGDRDASSIRFLILSLRSPAYSNSYYILKPTEQKGVYEAEMPSVRQSGTYTYAVSLYQRIPLVGKNIKGVLNLIMPGIETLPRGAPTFTLDFIILLFIFILLILILIRFKRYFRNS